MVKEAKNIDFYTSGRQPSEKDFARISEWIIKQKAKQLKKKEVAKKNSIKERQIQ